MPEIRNTHEEDPKPKSILKRILNSDAVFATGTLGSMFGVIALGVTAENSQYNKIPPEIIKDCTRQIETVLKTSKQDCESISEDRTKTRCLDLFNASKANLITTCATQRLDKNVYCSNDGGNTYSCLEKN